MYRLAYKHIELFKQIPFAEFIVNSSFINKVVTMPEKYGSYENILKCYYFISEEIWDPSNNRPLIQYKPENSSFYFYDFIKKRPETLKTKRFKHINLFNGVLDRYGRNRHFRKYHGLVAQRKPGVKKEELEKMRDGFIEFAHFYNQDLKYYKRKELEVPTTWAEHLYDLLKQLTEKSDFFYKKRGSLTLTQEMVNVLGNQSLFVYSSNLIRYGQNRQKVIRQIKEQKQFMFGELKHDIEHYKEIKKKLSTKQQTR